VPPPPDDDPIPEPHDWMTPKPKFRCFHSESEALESDSIGVIASFEPAINVVM
jgi:hypothetical protein